MADVLMLKQVRGYAELIIGDDKVLLAKETTDSEPDSAVESWPDSKPEADQSDQQPSEEVETENPNWPESGREIFDQAEEQDWLISLDSQEENKQGNDELPFSDQGNQINNKESNKGKNKGSSKGNNKGNNKQKNKGNDQSNSQKKDKNNQGNKVKRIFYWICWLLIVTDIFFLAQMSFHAMKDTQARGYYPSSAIEREYVTSEVFVSMASNNVERIYLAVVEDEPVPDLVGQQGYYYARYHRQATEEQPALDRQRSNSPNENFQFFSSQQYHLKLTSEDSEYLSIEGSIPATTVYRVQKIAKSDSLTVYFAYKQGYIEEMEELWHQGQAYYHQYLFKLLLGLIGLLILGIGLIVLTSNPVTKSPNLVERVYTEIPIFLIVISFPIVLWILSRFDYEINPNVTVMTINGLLLAAALFLTAAATVDIALFLLLVRKIKRYRLIKDSLTYKMLHWIYRGLVWLGQMFKNLFDGRAYKNHPTTKKLFYSQMAYILASAMTVGLLLIGGFIFGVRSSLLVFLGIIFLVLFEAAITAWYLGGNRVIYQQIKSEINENIAQKQKSENTKTELITNVSHDLKTPLTSIISYVDLLKKEELNPVAQDYVNIISAKAERLKEIVADLFELSKSVTGNLEIELERLDLVKLVEQTLAELRDQIDQSGLLLKSNYPIQPLFIYSDGKKMYRVLQNIIDNCLKYSLQGTRVFVEVAQQQQRACVTIKNTANYEMDFTAEDIMARFSRGDQSRTGDGSGLGLSIAESFTHSCGGEFELTIDGDLFKVEICFPIHA